MDKLKTNTTAQSPVEQVVYRPDAWILRGGLRDGEVCTSKAAARARRFGAVAEPLVTVARAQAMVTAELERWLAHADAMAQTLEVVEALGSVNTEALRAYQAFRANIQPSTTCRSSE